MTQEALLALFFFTHPGVSAWEGSCADEEQEARDLLGFVRAGAGSCRVPAPALVRITSTLRIYIGSEELKIRPMAKAILLLFLRHPEGILLKRISDYRAELTADYRRVMRSLEPEDAERRVLRVLDVFSNELNVNIARVNAALSELVSAPQEELYKVNGRAGRLKYIPLDRTLVIWE